LSDAPLLLAVESATARASVAVLHGDHVLGRRDDRTGQHHSETLLPMLDALLAEIGAELADVEAFAISIGPGAFTSLRIGLATVKGLAFASDRPVVAIPTLEALAYSALHGDPANVSAPAVVATLDARRGEVYAAAWQPEVLGSDLAPAMDRPALLAPGVYTPEALARSLPAGTRVVGEGASILAASESDLGALQLEGLPHSMPDAVAVGRIARCDLAAGLGGPAADLVPLYLRLTQAEEERKRAAQGRAPGPPHPL